MSLSPTIYLPYVSHKPIPRSHLVTPTSKGTNLPESPKIYIWSQSILDKGSSSMSLLSKYIFPQSSYQISPPGVRFPVLCHCVPSSMSYIFVHLLPLWFVIIILLHLYITLIIIISTLSLQNKSYATSERNISCSLIISSSLIISHAFINCA